ncbi:hypothetical protein FN976_04465 [Caenimonas sedimenti]|uniref:MFS transporter permease n=1 Tax=Caenimonas sedimenti TaxID=2596921 RepID=A0A562ZVZ7_9BURK|nr:DUF6064 family protein [Caenimonas sedimenti]TWO72792.1 hypothetical protein FN976_04465 [Caenimonas sedimenti]
MSEWWSYGLSDFLMFAPGTYWRFVELHNREYWPGPLVAGILGLAAWWITARQGPGGQRWMMLLLAAAWFWVGWAFYWDRLAQIHLAAPLLAGAALVQGALLVAVGLVPQHSEPRPISLRMRRASLAAALGAIVLYPWAGLLTGRPLAQAEVFGWMPDPTALGTLGLVFAVPALRLWQRGLLAVLPALFMLAGAVHHASMAQ